MILTPVLNPPLDTAKGRERTNIQLTDIDYNVTTNTYEFNFDKLERWVFICRQAGIRNFELSHLFSQWDGAFAPNRKILKRLRLLLEQNLFKNSVFSEQ